MFNLLAKKKKADYISVSLNGESIGYIDCSPWLHTAFLTGKPVVRMTDLDELKAVIATYYGSSVKFTANS